LLHAEKVGLQAGYSLSAPFPVFFLPQGTFFFLVLALQSIHPFPWFLENQP
jgi:hypothetical protein